MCTGSGALALLAASDRRRDVVAVDVSSRAVATARANARLRGLRVEVLRGDLFEPVSDHTFHLVLANPPYVPTRPRATNGYDRRWDAGEDGRIVIDRLCREVHDRLRPGGVLLLVQSALSGVAPTVDALREAGLRTRVVERTLVPFGPVLNGRAQWLEERGLVDRGQREEELVVIRAQRAA